LGKEWWLLGGSLAGNILQGKAFGQLKMKKAEVDLENASLKQEKRQLGEELARAEARARDLQERVNALHQTTVHLEAEKAELAKQMAEAKKIPPLPKNPSA
jgi:hypothetical protein